ncbi:HEL291Cp [Eremothecium sinecaudum]|uniref:Reticulon-like protein n=1 Tax=Eremothecium sinecaudum TaxID=45286 RepID=A0A0X8HT76_9SACH|nr:HEL291Cp [Eremothecium sinecaudum]AMD20990.1 HEL291Cp [Eremothecium sinecaudum]
MSSCDLLLWKNPLETGKVFGGLVVALLILKKVNLVTFFLRVLYTTLFASSTIEFVSKVVLGQGLVTKYGVKECPNLPGMLRPKMEEFLKQLPYYQSQMRQLLFAASPQHSFKAAGVLYILHKLISTVRLWPLLMIGVVSTFSLPLVYKTYQREIDSAVEHGVKTAKTKSAEFQQIASEKASPYVKQVEEKLGPISQYLSPKSPSSSNAASAVPLSTASSRVSEPSYGSASGSSFPKVPSAELSPGATKEEDVVAGLKANEAIAL